MQVSPSARRIPHRLGGFLPLAVFALAACLVGGCSPTVKVQAPSEPITINMNVKIEHEILVKVDRQVDALLQEQSDIFQ